MRYLKLLLPGLLLFACAGDGDPDLKLVAAALPKAPSERQALLRDLEEGFRAYERRDAQASFTKLDRVVRAGVRHPVLLYKLAVVGRNSGQQDRALLLFREAGERFVKELPAHPYAIHAWLALGNQQLRRKERAAALESFERAHALRGEDPQVLTALGRWHFLGGDYRTAVVWLARVQDHPPGELLLVEAYLRLQRYPPALATAERLQRILDRFPAHDRPRVEMNLGLALIGRARESATARDYPAAYRLAMRARGIFIRINDSFSGDADPFLKRLPPERRQYYINRSREYRDLCRQMVASYGKKL